MILLPIIFFAIPCCSGSSLNGVWQWTSDNAISRFIKSLSEPNEQRPDRGKRHGGSGFGYVEECQHGYENVVNSTMCMPDSEKYVAGSAGVSEVNKSIILEEHNRFRSGASPSAKAMRKLYWDDELAKVAEKWAKQCIVGHDLPHARYIPMYNTIPGQNGGYQLDGWAKVIGAWFNEREDFLYGQDPDEYIGPGGWVKIGHYSMMMIDDISRIGCGYARCTAGARDYYFCNYIPGPTLIPFPYRVGRSCDSCPNNCSMNLCDCGRKYCFNGGELDLTTCECSCKFPFEGSECLVDPCPGSRCSNDGILDVNTCSCSCPYPYTGRLCDSVSCDNRPDGEACEALTNNYCVFLSVRKACPMLCGVCPDYCQGEKCELGWRNMSDCQCIYPCGSKKCNGRGKLDIRTCNCTCKYPYTGDDCQTKLCTDQLDPDFCEVYWPSYLCTFSQVLLYCPVMCGTCEAPCSGLRCRNHGMLTKECTCRCHYPYSGSECEIKTCEKKADRHECGMDWPESYCSRFSNVRILCPNLCGICPTVCNGKRCLNFGTLDGETCECNCHQNYTGEFCETEKCGGKVCQNSGTLDLDTCYCECPPNYLGDECELSNCPDHDPPECNTTIEYYMCWTEWEIKYVCPYLCDRCLPQ